MKIATWNLERLKRTSSEEKTTEIIAILKELNADILILTETNSVINLGEEYSSLSSDPLPVPGLYGYKHGENQTTIWSKYPLSRVKTCHPSITVCAKVQTPNGDLNVYGTVIGILGPVASNRKGFLLNLKEQIENWNRILVEERNICIAGDFNVCWSGELSPKAERDEIFNCFDKQGIINLTHRIENNIDHVAISNSFLKNAKYEVELPWNLDKKLSDHIGVSVNVTLDINSIDVDIEH